MKKKVGKRGLQTNTYLLGILWQEGAVVKCEGVVRLTEYLPRPVIVL